jgi:hypothetical protein
MIQLTLNQKQHGRLISSSKELVERELRIAQGTINCAQKSLTQKFL